MGLVAGFVVYVLLWWWVLFMVLPFGSAPPEVAEEGHAPSAPARPRLWLKLLVTSVIAFGLWVVAYVVIESGYFSFRDMARDEALERLGDDLGR